MTTYEKIKELLSLGTIKGVICKDSRDGTYTVCLSCQDNLAKRTNYHSSIDDIVYERPEGSINYNALNEHYTIVKPIAIKPKTLPVGTRVRILDIVETIKEYPEWSEISKKTREGVISKVVDEQCGVWYIVRGSERSINIPTYCVVPYDCCSIEDPKKEALKKDIEDMKEKLKEMEKKLEE